jgi:integrase
MSKFTTVAAAIRAGKGHYNAEQSLYCRVDRNRNPTWQYHVRLEGKLKTICLGRAADRTTAGALTVGQARERRNDLWKQYRQLRARNRLLPSAPPGSTGEPLPVPIPIERRLGEVANHTLFTVARDEWLKNAMSHTTEEYRDKIRARLKNHVSVLFAKPVGTITKSDVLHVLRQIEAQTIRARVRADIEAILGYCDVEPNPATRAALKGKLAKGNGSKPHDALPIDNVPAFYGALCADKRMMAYALRFVILTGCRISEVIEAPWSEFDLNNRVWVIPAERMKKRLRHRVPLTDAMIEILNAVGPAHDGFVFWSNDADTGHVSDVALRKLVKAVTATLFPGITATVHGFRACITSWFTEKRYRELAIDFAIAHVEGSESRKAYQRSDLFDERREMMGAWGNFVTNVSTR